MTLKIVIELKEDVLPREAVEMKASITKVYRNRINRSFVVIEPRPDNIPRLDSDGLGYMR